MAKKSIHDLQLEIENEEHYLAFLKNSKAKDCSSDIQRGVADEQIIVSKKRLYQLKHKLKVRTSSTEHQPLVFPMLEALDSYELESVHDQVNNQ